MVPRERLTRLADQIPLLTFHTIDREASVVAFPPEGFARGLKMLHERGFRAISLCQVAESLRHKVAFPERTVTITFDDGYQSVYEQAFPVLQQYNMPATIFLTVGPDRTRAKDTPFPTMNGRVMLNWCQVQEMQRYGIAMGAHTLNHPDLTRLHAQRQRAEILNSKAIIEDRSGEPVTCFAYPFGRYDRQSYEIVREHFACACTDRLQFVNLQSDVHLLERVDTYYLRNRPWNHLLSSSLLRWYVQLRRIPRNLRRAAFSAIPHLQFSS